MQNDFASFQFNWKFKWCRNKWENRTMKEEGGAVEDEEGKNYYRSLKLSLAIASTVLIFNFFWKKILYN